MNPEAYEDTLLAELRNHIGTDWTARLTNNAEAPEGTATVRFDDSTFSQPEGIDDNNVHLSADITDIEMSIVFTSAPQAPRSVFDGAYKIVKDTCRALTKDASRGERWQITGAGREFSAEGEAPKRTLVFGIAVEGEASA